LPVLGYYLDWCSGRCSISPCSQAAFDQKLPLCGWCDDADPPTAIGSWIRQLTLSKSEVVSAYRGILGRDPENAEVVELYTGFSSLEELLKEFVSSKEFAARMRSAPDAPSPPPINGELANARDFGKWEEAARHYRQALDQVPENSLVWVQYGSALKEQGLLEPAEEAYRRALAIDNRMADAHLRLGHVLQQQGRHGEAAAAYIAAYRLDPSSRFAAEELRKLSPEIAGRALGASHAEFGQFDTTTQRREALAAVGLPSPARLPVELTPTIARPLAPRTLPQVSHCLALIATRNFLPFAKMAARSFLAHHSEFQAFLLLVDGEPQDAAAFCEGHVVLLSDLSLENAGWYAAKFTASEFSNALKPAFLRYLSEFVETVFYMDSDILVCSRLTEMIDLADVGDLVLIPHMLKPFPRPEQFYTRPTRADIFHSGLINAGCFAISLSRTREFLTFWEEANFAPGAFYEGAGYQTDQQHLNWALVTVPGARVLRESRYNVAYWNLHERDFRVASTQNGTPQFEVDHKPLGFFHFSGYDIENRLRLSRHDERHSVYNLPAVAEILNWYSDQILACPTAELLHEPYGFDQLANGFQLSRFTRELLKKYETYAPRFNLETRTGADALCAFLMDPLPAAGSMLPLVAAAIYEARPDLQRSWPGRIPMCRPMVSGAASAVTRGTSISSDS